MSSDYKYKVLNICELSGEPSNRNAFREEPSNLWCIRMYICICVCVSLYVCIQVCYYTQNTHTHTHLKHTHTVTCNKLYHKFYVE